MQFQDLEQGLNQGLKQKAIESAKKMLLKRFCIEDISDMTGLSAEEIIKIQKK